MPLAHDDVVGVEHFQSAMQYLEDGLGIFLIVWRGADQFPADRQRFDEAAAVEIDRQLRAFEMGVRRIERRRPPEGFCGLVQATQPMQEICSVEMIFCRVRRKIERAIDRDKCILGPTA